jgi:hypothetical protein
MFETGLYEVHVPVLTGLKMTLGAVAIPSVCLRLPYGHRKQWNFAVLDLPTSKISVTSIRLTFAICPSSDPTAAARRLCHPQFAARLAPSESDEV